MQLIKHKPKTFIKLQTNLGTGFLKDQKQFMFEDKILRIAR
jgi:hypothetical protein